jgi:hypothetical protein
MAAAAPAEEIDWDTCGYYNGEVSREGAAPCRAPWDWSKWIIAQIAWGSIEVLSWDEEGVSCPSLHVGL